MPGNAMAEKKASEATYLGSRYITDGVHRGVVRITSVTHVYIVDLLTGQKHKLVPSQVRRMTPREIIEYNETPAVSDPSPAEIAERSQAIKEHWTPVQRSARKRTSNFFNFVDAALNGA